MGVWCVVGLWYVGTRAGTKGKGNKGKVRRSSAFFFSLLFFMSSRHACPCKAAAMQNSQHRRQMRVFIGNTHHVHFPKHAYNRRKFEYMLPPPAQAAPRRNATKFQRRQNARHISTGSPGIENVHPRGKGRKGTGGQICHHRQSRERVKGTRAFERPVNVKIER